MKKSRFNDSQILAILKQGKMVFRLETFAVNMGSAMPRITTGARNLAVWMHR